MHNVCKKRRPQQYKKILNLHSIFYLILYWPTLKFFLRLVLLQVCTLSHTHSLFPFITNQLFLHICVPFHLHPLLYSLMTMMVATGGKKEKKLNPFSTAEVLCVKF